MKIYTITIISIAILLSIYLIPDDVYDRYEYFIRLLRGAAVLSIISSVLMTIFSLI